jgi:2Fe-2S ferredoxin
MTKITFIEYNGTEHKVDAEDGMVVMRVGRANDIPTIRGECGGICDCGSCHVYVEAPWEQKLDPPIELEEMMLGSLTFTKKDNSRLSCRITVSPELDGLVLRLPNPDL